MMTVRDYRERAAECERLARQSRSEKRRQEFLRIAESWRKLAGEHEPSEPGPGAGRTDPEGSAPTIGAEDDDQRCDEQGGKNAKR